MQTRRLVVALAVLSAGLPMPLRAADDPFRQRSEIAIGGEGGWDYLAVDAAARRLYVSHATKVVVVDLDKNAVVGRSRRRRACTASPSPPNSAEASSATAARTRRHRRPEDAEDHLQRRDRREPGRDPVRAGAQGGLHVQRPRQVGHGLRRDDGRGEGDDPAARQAGVRGGGRQGGAHLQQHRGHEPARRHRHGDARGRGDLADRAGRGSVGPGHRPREPPAVRRLQQPADGDGGQHHRQGPGRRCRSAPGWTPTRSTRAPASSSRRAATGR